MTRSGCGSGVERRSDRGYGLTDKSDVQAAMGAIKNKYFRRSERGYVPMSEYNKTSKAQKPAVYFLYQDQDGSSRPYAVTDTHQDYSNLKRQVSAISNKV